MTFRTYDFEFDYGNNDDEPERINLDEPGTGAEAETGRRVPHRNLEGATDPSGPDVHQVVDNAESTRWFLQNAGAAGMAGEFRRGEQMVHTSRVDEEGYVPPLKPDDDNGPATVRPTTVESLQARFVQHYLIWSAKDVGRGENKRRVRTERIFPGESLRIGLQAIEAMPNLRPLCGVTHTPMIRKDGSVLDEPGYDEGIGFLYLPTIDVPTVPTEPTADEVRAAVGLLRGMVAEFAWVGPHDEAAFLGVLLTPLLRNLAPPPYKLIGVMAHQRGSGKSLLAWIVREVHGGVFRSELPHDDPEMDKALVSILSQTTAPVVVFDNVSGVFRSSRFDGLLTSAVYSGRVLGSTNHVEFANDRLWLITGNNLVLSGDLDRRTLLVTIDPMTPKPELRTGFKLDLVTWVPEHRGELLHALLTLVRAWVVAGKPMERRSSDSYAHWAAVVRGILTHAGVPGEFDHASCAPEQDNTDPDGWGVFLEAVRRQFGDRSWAVKELLALVHDGRQQDGQFTKRYNDAHPISLDVLPTELAEKFIRNGAAGVSRSLGMWLRNRNRRFAGELAGVEASKDRDGVKHWRVLTADEMRGSRGDAA